MLHQFHFSKNRSNINMWKVSTWTMGILLGSRCMQYPFLKILMLLVSDKSVKLFSSTSICLPFSFCRKKIRDLFSFFKVPLGMVIIDVSFFESIFITYCPHLVFICHILHHWSIRRWYGWSGNFYNIFSNGLWKNVKVFMPFNIDVEVFHEKYILPLTEHQS